MCGLKDAQQFVWQLPVISVTLPSSILGSTCAPSPRGQIFQAAKKPRVDIPQLLEARIAWMHLTEVNRQKVLSPASVRRESLLDRTFAFRMPSLRWAIEWAIEWAIRDFAPCERFLLSIRLIRWQQFTYQTKRMR